MDGTRVVVTGMNAMNTGEGERIGFTYSVMTQDGKIIKQNAKGSLIVMDEEVKAKLTEIKAYLKGWIEKNET